MSKRLMLLVITFGFFMLSYSQVKYGIKAGITQSFVKETPTMPDIDNTLKTGFQIGVFMDKTFSNDFILRPSLQLTQKGYQSVVGNPGGPFYWSRNLSTTYFELPVNLLRRFTLNQTSNFYVGTGPVVGYGLKGNLKAAVVSMDNNQQLHTTISNDYEIFKNDIDRRLDFGWDFAVGIQSCRILFNASYNHGITNVVKGNDQSLKNRSIAFTVGYFL